MTEPFPVLYHITSATILFSSSPKMEGRPPVNAVTVWFPTGSGGTGQRLKTCDWFMTMIDRFIDPFIGFCLTETRRIINQEGFYDRRSAAEQPRFRFPLSSKRKSNLHRVSSLSLIFLVQEFELLCRGRGETLTPPRSAEPALWRPLWPRCPFSVEDARFLSPQVTCRRVAL